MVLKYLVLRLITDDKDPEPEDALESPVDGGLTDLNRLKLGFGDIGKDAISLWPFPLAKSSPSFVAFVAVLLVIMMSGKCLLPCIICNKLFSTIFKNILHTFFLLKYKS